MIIMKEVDTHTKRQKFELQDGFPFEAIESIQCAVSVQSYTLMDYVNYPYELYVHIY